MKQQAGIVKGNALWKNSRAGSSHGAPLLGHGGLSKLSAAGLREYASHPNPVADYAEAVRRVESKIATDKVVNLWRTRGAKDVQTYQFPAELRLGHDIIDVKDPDMNVAAVYPKLLELIDQ